MCRKFRAAAAQATAADLIVKLPKLDASSMSLLNKQRARHESFQRWLNLHGNNIIRLTAERLSLGGQPPCRRLESLVLESCVITPCSVGDIMQPVLKHARGLRKVVLKRCLMFGGPAAEREILASLLKDHTKLQHLCIIAHEESTGSPDCCSLPSDLLPTFVRLTSLHLAGSLHLIDERISQGLSSLTALKELFVDTAGDTTLTAHAFSTIHHATGLTALSLSTPTLVISPQHTPGIARLTTLQCLKLFRPLGFHAAITSSMSALQELWLHKVTVIGGPAALLDMMADLPKLRTLNVHAWHATASAAGAQLPAAAYSKLLWAASTELQHVVLSEVQLPMDVWRPILAVNTFQHLQHLKILSATTTTLAAAAAAVGDAGVSDREQHLLSDADVWCIADNCPSLQELDITQQLQQGVRLSALHQLAGLTRLHTGGGLSSEALTNIAQLTGLQHLCLLEDVRPELMCLTVLTGLTHICVQDVFARECQVGCVFEV